MKHVEPFRGSFVGRDADIEAIDRLVSRGARLVTLLGPGGVGKTRLLNRVAQRLDGAYESTLWCDLSSASSVSDVIGSVATAASGIAFSAATTAMIAIERVGRALQRRGKCLLALDNLEQLEAAALPLLVRWLGEAPSLLVLTTSRVRLGLAGEVVHQVGPLSLAPPEGGSSDALRLFEDRALGVRSAFSPEESVVAGRIVALLDGIPLALEMAATRLGVLHPDELLQRLSRPLQLLSSGVRGDPERHASLSRVLDESWELLGEDERRALAEIGVFVGGFTIEAAEAALAVRSDVVGVLQRLVDSSLVRSVPSRTQRRRNAPYEVVREYALERLVEEGRLDDVRVRHAIHFATWGEGRLAAFTETALHELVDEEANLTAAVSFVGTGARLSEMHPEVRWRDVNLRLHAVLEPVRMLRGQLDVWALQLAAAVDSDLAAEPFLLARVRLALARALHELGRPEAARLAYEAALAEARAAKDPSLEGFGLAGLGRLIAGLGQWEDARALFAAARALPGATAAVRKYGRACLEFYGTESGATTEVVVAVAEYVEECRRGGDPRELVFWLVQLGRAESELTRARRDAEAHLEEALTLARRLGDLRGEGFALFGLGAHHMGYRRFDDAASMLVHAARMLREAGTRRYEAWAIGFQGTSHAALGRWTEAIVALDEAIGLLKEVGDAPREAHLLAFRGAVRARLDDESRASADLARALELAPAESRYHAWTIELCKGQLDLLRARAAFHAAAAEEGRMHLGRARDLLERAGWPSGGCLTMRAWPWGNEFFEPRLAAELLERGMADVVAPRAALVVDSAGSFFVLPSGERVGSGRRGKIQRILFVLARERIAHAGRAVNPSTLVAAAWPGERMRPNAAQNRLHVALDTLRKLGLRELLLRREGGWLLDPEVPCAWDGPSES